jgi:hypothetical protein
MVPVTSGSFRQVCRSVPSGDRTARQLQKAAADWALSQGRAGDGRPATNGRTLPALIGYRAAGPGVAKQHGRKPVSAALARGRDIC